MSRGCFIGKIIFVIFLSSQAVKCQEIVPKIVGGVNVTSIAGFKHQVSIRLASADRSFGYGHRCGGSLISYRTVLTAAHCIHDGNKFMSASNFVCAMGGLYRWVRDNNTLYIYVSKAIGHSGYKPRTFENDIGVLILNQEVPMNHPTAQPIPLSTKNAAAGQSCQISGWGTTAFKNGNQPNQLLMANLVINSKSECNQPNSHNGNVLSGMFCAGSFSGPNLVDSCQGDSGGPLTCQGVLVGITSNGVECALPNYPGIYIDVNQYKNWIYKNSSTPTCANQILTFISLAVLCFLSKCL